VKRPRAITHEWLVEHGACEDQRAVFAAEWPDGVVLSEQSLYRAAELGLNLGWFAREYLPAPRWAEYQRRVAPIWAEYQRQRVSPRWAEYQRQRVAPIWAEYQRQRVAPLLWRIARRALGEEGK
jgi:hypothetical protein